MAPDGQVAIAMEARSRPSIALTTCIVEHHSTAWRDWLLFRDYLRTHVQAAARYAELKQELAAADRSDRVRYRAGKAPLIAELMEQARAWSDAGQ